MPMRRETARPANTTTAKHDTYFDRLGKPGLH